MKLRIEFEDNDLHSMITQYFASAGFEVRNLHDLCEQFKTAFPDGIFVDVLTVGKPTDNSIPEPPPAPRNTTPSEVLDVAESQLQAADPAGRLTASQLVDPTHSSQEPVIDSILKMSRDLERNADD